MRIVDKIARFKKLADAQEALKSRNYSKAEKPGKKGWRNARWEIALIFHPNSVDVLTPTKLPK